MKNMLKNSAYKDQIELLTFESFVKMEMDTEYDQFNQMYEEYSKLREARLKDLSDREKGTILYFYSLIN